MLKQTRSLDLDDSEILLLLHVHTTCDTQTNILRIALTATGRMMITCL